MVIVYNPRQGFQSTPKPTGVEIGKGVVLTPQGGVSSPYARGASTIGSGGGGTSKPVIDLEAQRQNELKIQQEIERKRIEQETAIAINQARADYQKNLRNAQNQNDRINALNNLSQKISQAQIKGQAEREKSNISKVTQISGRTNVQVVSGGREQVVAEMLRKQYREGGYTQEQSNIQKEELAQPKSSIQKSTTFEKVQSFIKQKTGIYVPSGKEVYSNIFRSNQAPYEQSEEITTRRTLGDIGESVVQVSKISGDVLGEVAYQSREAIPYKAKEVTIPESSFFVPQRITVTEQYKGQEFKIPEKTYEPYSSETFRKTGQFVGFGLGFGAVESTIGIPTTTLLLAGATTTPRKISTEERLGYGMLTLVSAGAGILKVIETIPRKSLGGLSKQELKELATAEGTRYNELRLKALRGYEKQGDLIGATAFERTILPQQPKIINWIATSEKQIAKAGQERLTRLKELDKGSSILRLNIPSAYEEAIKYGQMSYVGKGAEELSIKNIQVLKQMIKSDLGLSKQQINKVTKDVGLYKQLYEVVPPSKLELYKGSLGDIKQEIILPELKYTQREFPKGTSYALENTQTTKQGSRGIGIQFELGKKGIINKQTFGLISNKQGNLVRFDIYGTGRKSTRIIGEGISQLKQEIFPAGRLIEQQLAKSKVLSIKKEGDIIKRTYETTYADLYVTPRRVSNLDIIQTYTERPTNKQFKKSFKTSKELTSDIILPENKEFNLQFAGEVKGDIGKSVTELKIIKPYTQIGTGRRLEFGEQIIIPEETAGTTIVGSGRKSSQKYIQSLYQEKLVVPKPKPTIKYSKTNLKIIEFPTLSSQELAPIMVGGLGLERSAYYGIRGTAIEETTYLSPIRINLPMNEIKIKNDIGTIQVNQLEVKQREELDIGLIQKNKLSMDLIQEPRLNIGTKTKQETQLIQKNNQEELLQQKQIQIQQLRQKELLQQKQIQIQQLRQKLINDLKINLFKPRLKQLPKPKITPPFITPPFITSGTSSKQKVMSIAQDINFEVIGKRFGKEFSLGEFTSQPKAEETLKVFLKKTLGRSGKITKEGKALEFGELRTFGYEFNPSKRDVTRIVQKAKFSLSSYPERKEIQSFRKRGGNKKFKLI